MKAVAGALVAAALLVLAASPAAAGGTKIIISGGHFDHRSGFRHPGFRHKFFVGHPQTKIIYVVPSSPRWVPGYWTYQWIPQVYTSYVWVPGHYDPNWYWLEGHYLPHTVQTGYHQPIWVSGYWLP